MGDLVWVRDYRHQQQHWEAGQIIKILGPVTYSVKVSGTEWKRHADQLRPRVPTETTVVSEPQPQGDLQDIPDPSTGDSSEATPSQSSTADSESSDGAGILHRKFLHKIRSLIWSDQSQRQNLPDGTLLVSGNRRTD